MIACILLGCSSHCAKSVRARVLLSMVSHWTVTRSLLLCFNWRLVSDVRGRPHCTPPAGHDIAGPGIHLDLPKTLASGKAGFWTLKQRCGAWLPPDWETGRCWKVGWLRCNGRTRTVSLRSIRGLLWSGSQMMSLLHLPCRWLSQQQVTVRPRYIIAFRANATVWVGLHERAMYLIRFSPVTNET